MWGVKVMVVPVVIGAVGALGAVTPKLTAWLQEIPRTISEISVQKNALLGQLRFCAEPSNSKASGIGPELEGDTAQEGPKDYGS